MNYPFDQSRHLFGLLIVVAALTLPTLSFAFGSAGHRLVGAVADINLTPQARIAVRRIMGSDSLADVATWMDEVRGTKEGIAMKPWHFDSVDVCNPSPA